MRPARVALGVAFALLGFAGIGRAQVLPPGFEEETLVVGLNVPTCMVFPSDGRIFVGEQAGTIRLIEAGVLQPQPMIYLQVETYREQGLVGMTLDPDFPNHPYIYVVYTHATGNHTDNHHWVSRFTVDGDTIDPASEVVLFDQIPTGIGFHVGGCIRFGADGNLLISCGDTNWAPPFPQDLTRLEGKLLRLRPDGSVPPDNPFVGIPGVRPEIYQYGLRNPFRFSIQPGTGAVFIADVGASAYEEVNVGPPGANFGWPLHEGPAVPPDSTMIDPLYAYPHVGPSAAIVGNIFYQGTGFPVEFIGNYFFFDHVRGSLGRIVLEPGNTIASVDTAWMVTSVSGAGYGPVDLEEGPDGALYYNTYYPGTIRRIFYSGSENRRPTALASADRTNGYTPLPIEFSGAASFDIDGDSLQYDWNFGDGSPHATTRAAAHTYDLQGVFAARLTVNDGRGGEAVSQPITITVGDLAPIVEIDTPADGTTFLDDDVIVFGGSASDPESGPMPAAELHWRVLLHHLTHVHPVILDQTGSGGSFVAEFHDDEPQNVYYSITAWAVDSEGLRGERRVEVHPNPAPPGGITRMFVVPSNDRDAVTVQDTVRVGGYNDGKPFDYASRDADAMSGAMEFQLDLPDGATILEANLILRAGPQQTVSFNGALEIYSYDIADATPFTNGVGNLLAKHPTLPEPVQWPAPSFWLEGDFITSPDLTAPVQAFVSRPDYVAGNHIGFVITPGTIDSDAMYGWADYASLGLPTRLRLKYTVPTDVTASLPSHRALKQNVPNPFNPSTRIEFSLATPGPARLEILDVRGRLVRVLQSGALGAGAQVRFWDGRDAHGAAAASGVYVYRLRTAAGSESRRMTLVR